MAEIWLAGAAAFASLAALLCLVIDAFQDRKIMETLEFLADENDKLRLQNTEILRRIEATNANVLFVERKLNK